MDMLTKHCHCRHRRVVVVVGGSGDGGATGWRHCRQRGATFTGQLFNL